MESNASTGCTAPLDTRLIVRHWMNLSITICGLFPDPAVLVTFWQHFIRVLGRRPVPALAALYWQLTRRRIRARNRLRVASADLPFAYELWIASNELPSVLASDSGVVSSWAHGPKFVVVLHSSDGHTQVQRLTSIASLEQQTYPNWTLIESKIEQIGATSSAAEGDWIVPLRAGDRLSKDALLRFAEASQDHPDAGILYSDEDRLDERGRRRQPWFKPQWNEELFLAQDYLSSSVAIQAKLAREAAAECNGDLQSVLLAATERATSIVHVPHILVHVAHSFPEPDRLEAVAAHLKERHATCRAGPYGTVKVEWPLPEKLPLVSVIIPTRDKVELLRPCLESILGRTDYPNFELLIIDNNSSEKRTADFLLQVSKHSAVRILNYDRPFNYSAINNFGAHQAQGSYLCLLNNDTQVLEPAWLTELMRYAIRPDVGAAGGKLVYEDGSIQHAGVVVGIGDAAGHPHRFLPAGQPGYFRMPHVAHFVSAVTGACLAIEKKKFCAVGGLDEDNLRVAFNDVDLCLKLERAGWRNVYVPHAILVHHESKTRGSDMEPNQLERYRRELKVLQDRWSTKTYIDPLHNPNLDRYSETYVFRL